MNQANEYVTFIHSIVRTEDSVAGQVHDQMVRQYFDSLATDIAKGKKN